MGSSFRGERLRAASGVESRGRLQPADGLEGNNQVR